MPVGGEYAVVQRGGMDEGSEAVGRGVLEEGGKD